MMTSFSILIIVLIALSQSITHTSSISISIPNHTFQITGDSLFGDAHFSGDKNSVQLNRAEPSSFGIVLTTTPFSFTYATSFYTNFTFDIGNGVSLVIIPSKLAKTTSFELLEVNRLLDIEFDVNLCRISSSRVSNVTKISNVVKDGMKLTVWIDYRAVLKRLDVRLSKLGDSKKPVEPLISYRIDLGEVMKGEEVLFGLASVNGNHDKVTSVYSWSVEMNEVPKWMHSMPVIPLDYVKTSKKKGCFISGFVYATGCGALAALVLFFAWLYVADRKKVQTETSVLPVDFKYEKIGVVDVKNSETAMK